MINGHEISLRLIRTTIFLLLNSGVVKILVLDNDSQVRLDGTSHGGGSRSLGLELSQSWFLAAKLLSTLE